MDRLLIVLLALVARLLPPPAPPKSHRAPRLYRGRRRGTAAQVLAQDHEWTAYLKQMGAWRHDGELITI